MAEIDFWFSIGSTYTALSVARLGQVEAETGARFRWRPFNVRHVMTEQKNIPFAGKPEKSAYMWRDIARRSAGYRLDLQVPAPYPVPDLPFVNCVALLGMREGWGRAFVEAAYRGWFVDGVLPDAGDGLARALAAAGVGVEAVERARGADVVAALAEETAEAMRLGVFGSPSFVVDGEVFWGDDRLEDALAWAEGRLSVPSA